MFRKGIRKKNICWDILLTRILIKKKKRISFAYVRIEGLEKEIFNKTRFASMIYNILIHLN